MAARTSDLGEVLRRDRRIRIQVSLYGVNTVAISAYGSLPVSTRNRLAMNALCKLCLHGAVTFGASCRNVELENRRLGIACGQDFMGTVAIGAYGSFV